ncbi:unnamed protein product [Adineta steineri]|uniref:Uncharacterized protein n=1 Tax=Adineta steineri TaxID=433720 RepID=A0A814XVC4_9BILA|nr:unnamed protein product [Adineta steineri]CAF1257609.1 unnamed protein product [Adineta steineri]CAF1436835.1 unnamed protein product [Adineta steineri]CAF1546204.1 unnamed protein product [Adineta steineri]
MAFSNLFRRHSTSIEAQAANYACMDENSTAETLLDELEMQCQNSLTLTSLRTKRNSEVLAHKSGLLASTYKPSSSSSKRRSSVDYSWLTPQNNLLQTPTELYHLSDIIKMELSELIHHVLPEDCSIVVNNFRRNVRSQAQSTTPETIIALFRKTVSDYIDQKQKTRRSNSNSNEIVKSNEGNSSTSTTINQIVRNKRILPKHQSEEEQHSLAELAQISLTSRTNDLIDVKPRSNTHV